VINDFIHMSRDRSHIGINTFVKGSGMITMDTLGILIPMLAAYRNAQILGIKVDELWKYEPGIGGSFSLGIKGKQCKAPFADMEEYTILYLAREIIFQDKIIHHNYSSHIGEKIKAATKHLELFPTASMPSSSFKKSNGHWVPD
jgi:hypothetical protein